MPEQPALAGVEVVGDGRLGVDILSWPNKLVETVLSPTVHCSNLLELKSKLEQFIFIHLY